MECTQSPYTSVIRRSPPVETCPGRSPSGLYLSSIYSVFSSVVVVCVPAFAFCSVYHIASGDGGAARCATTTIPFQQADFRQPPPPCPNSDLAPPSAETGIWRTHGTGSRYNGVLPSDKRIIGSCRSTLARICTKRRPAVSPICLVGV